MSQSPYGYESLIEQRIRQAQERGEFDNLPGTGKPLPRDDADDELWWVKGYLRREGLSTEALLPTSLQLAKALERLPEAAARLVDEPAVRDLVDQLNRRIRDYQRAPSEPRLPLKTANLERVLERWRAERPVPPESRAPAANTPRDVGKRRRWGRRADS